MIFVFNSEGGEGGEGGGKRSCILIRRFVSSATTKASAKREFVFNP